MLTGTQPLGRSIFFWVTKLHVVLTGIGHFIGGIFSKPMLMYDQGSIQKIIIPGFNITKYESQSNFVVQNIKFVFFFKIYKPTIFSFDLPFFESTFFADKPSDPTLL